jgi:class 3 adenylate cyclase
MAESEQQQAVRSGVVRDCAVLMTDIAGAVELRSRLGDPAGARIRDLLDAIIAAARSRGGIFIKSYGDDILAVFEREPLVAAAEVAAQAHQLAEAAGLRLYAGLHAGPVEFFDSDGRTDVMGQAVNIAARLHKLIDDVPGNIFLAAESVKQLPQDLQARATRFGRRRLKGIGQVEVWTLGWRPDAELDCTMSFNDRTGVWPAQTLNLHLGQQILGFPPDGVRRSVGRAAGCTLCVPDAERRVSSTHLLLEFMEGRWFAADVSRNGTWLRDQDSVLRLPPGKQFLLPRSGALCLGRPFGQDAGGGFTLEFRLSGA